MSARTRAPDSTKEMEELEAQATPKTQELEELEAQEEVEAYDPRREGPHIQKEDLGLESITLPEASLTSNPAEILTKEETVGEGRQDAGGPRPGGVSRSSSRWASQQSRIGGASAPSGTPSSTQGIGSPRTGPCSRGTSSISASSDSASMRTSTTSPANPRPKRHYTPPTQRTTTGSLPIARPSPAGNPTMGQHAPQGLQDQAAGSLSNPISAGAPPWSPHLPQPKYSSWERSTAP